MTSSRVIVGLASAFSMLVGVGLGHWLIDGRPTERPSLAAAPATATPAGSEELLSILRELRPSLEALTRTLEQRSVPERSVPVASQREAVETAPREAVDPDSLASALRALAAAIGELRSGTRSARAPATEELVTPAWVDREAAFAATGMRPAALSGVAARTGAQQSLRAKHLFKTYQEVLSLYGAPDKIEVENETRWWHYGNPFEGGGETFSFGFDEGTVFEARYRKGLP